MRRSKHSPAISPQQLKHFAVAAVVITMLLALFASGEDWGAKAQVQAVEAKNQLVATEAEKLGTRKIFGGLRVNRSPASFGESGPGGDFAMSGGAAPVGAAPMPAPPQSRTGSGQPPRDYPPLPEPGQTSVMVKDKPDPAKAKPNGRPPGPTSEAQREKAKAESRARSGDGGITS